MRCVKASVKRRGATTKTHPIPSLDSGHTRGTNELRGNVKRKQMHLLQREKAWLACSLLVFELLLGILVSSPTLAPLDGYSLCLVRIRSTYPPHPTIDIEHLQACATRPQQKIPGGKWCGTQSNIWGHSARCVCDTQCVFGWSVDRLVGHTGGGKNGRLLMVSMVYIYSYK